MKTLDRTRGSAWLVTAALVAGCADAPTAPPPAAPPPVYQPAPSPGPVVVPPSTAPAQAPVPTPSVSAAAAPSPAQKALAEGIAAYDSGDFNAAIRKLTTTPELNAASAPAALRIDALKYAAFSYCVTNRRALCRRQFDALLAIDAKYDLKPSEAGHPIWGPVFAQAKKAAQAPAPKKR